MDKYTEYQPDTGIIETQVFHDDGKHVTIHQQEDVAGVLEQCRQSRDLGIADKAIKQEGRFWTYAKIPTTVCYELIKKGLNPFDKNVSAKRLEQEIEQNYPYLKTTNKRAN